MTYPPSGAGLPVLSAGAALADKLPVYLTTSVVVLGLAAYLAVRAGLTVTAGRRTVRWAELNGGGGGYR